MNWISVKDRLPKDYGDMLVKFDDDIAVGYYEIGSSRWYSEIYDNPVVLKNVTHWMPLLDPPKEE